MASFFNWSVILEHLKSWFIYDPKSPILFNSILFLGFFIVFYAFYLGMLKKFKGRLIYMVIFSLFFYYKSSGIFFLLLIGMSIVDYFLANQIYHASKKSIQKLYVYISVIINLGILGYFKYTNFLIDSYNTLSGSDFNFYNIILPVGVSFFTFQSISYSVEVYRKEITPAKSFLDYLFFISFFPQLVAGPIVKAKEFLPQIHKHVQLHREDYNRAFILIIGGLIKKAIISDYISVNFVDRVFDAPTHYSGFANLMATYGYSIQIYCDFSGYSDMAIGIALLLGYKLPINFRTPYQSQSITEFWRRWHISLSTWLKEFLYIPTGGNRNGSFAGYIFPILFFGGMLAWGVYYYENSVWPLIIAGAALLAFVLSIALSPKWRKAVYTNSNLMTTMLLGGLWHGSNLRFIVWGGLHGLALAVHKVIIERFPSKREKPFWLWKFIAIFITFHFVTFCWIFFRAKSFDTGLEMMKMITQMEWNWSHWWQTWVGYTPVFLILAFAFIWHYIPQKPLEKLYAVFTKAPMPVQAVFLAALYWAVYATASAGPQPFIYFQF